MHWLKFNSVRVKEEGKNREDHVIYLEDPGPSRSDAPAWHFSPTSNALSEGKPQTEMDFDWVYGRVYLAT